MTEETAMKRELLRMTNEFLRGRISPDDWVAAVVKYRNFDEATQNLLHNATGETLREYARATKKLLEQ